MKKLLIVSLLLSLLTGCAPALAPTPTKDTGRLQIVATVFPAYDFARAAAGDLADVQLLLPPGTESHSYEPTPAENRTVGWKRFWTQRSPQAPRLPWSTA